MISIKGVSKSYGNLQVLKQIDLDIERGSLVTLAGASGAGKSTLLHIIGGLDKADKGDVFYGKQSLSQMHQGGLASFRNKHIGFVFQFHHLLPEFNALENVMIPGMIAGRSNKSNRDRAKELLDYMGLADRIMHKPNALSGGEQQRVAVCRALMNAPDVIIADEPSGNLDSKHSMKLHELFFELRDKSKQTFIIATHNEALAQMSDKCYHIKDGMIKGENK